MDNKKLLDAVSAALSEAGYTNIVAQDETDGAVVTATKDPGAALFRVTAQAKARVSPRTTAGGPEPQRVALEVLIAPVAAGLREHLRQNPAVAPAFGITAEALKLLK